MMAVFFEYSLTKAFVLWTILFGPGHSLLFHGDNDPTTPTPLGPLGLETTVSLLAKEITRLQTDMKTQEAKMKNQDDEILQLKTLLNTKNASTTSTANNLLNELNSLKSTVSSMKTDLDLINNSSGTQTLLANVNNMAQSIRYLTLSLQDQTTNLDSINSSLQQDISHLKIEHARDIATLKSNANSNSANVQSQISSVQSTISGLQTKTSSLQSHVNNLESTSSSLQSSFSGLQSKLTSLSSAMTSWRDTMLAYFRRLVLEGFNNGGLSSALHYTGIRLVGNQSNAGRVEIQINSAWGTVCDDHFDENSNAAKVVCRSLGKPWQNAAFHPAQSNSDLLILLDDVICSGSENSIASCRHSAFGVHNCGHGEDAGVICKITNNTVTVSAFPILAPQTGCLK